MIISIASLSDDLHAFAVRAQLQQSFAVTCHIFECDRIGGSGHGISWLPGERGPIPPALTSSDDTLVDLTEIDLTWFRRAWFGLNDVDIVSLSPAYRDFARMNSMAAGKGMFLCEFSGVSVDNPHRMERAENKIVQHYAAIAAGFRVPRTLISQSPAHIREFRDTLDRETVLKPIKQSPSLVATTKVVGDELISDEASMRLCPVMYQELIPGRRHIRAHVFGDQVLAALIESDHLDWRTNLNFDCHRYRLPDDIQKGLLDVLRNLGLSMGVFDLKITDQGEYVWLEVNPQGQFLFVEGICGLPLTRAMAEFLYTRALNR